MALAQEANDGALYPALYDGQNFGGTRFMPIPIVFHAGLARITNEYLESGKLLSYGSFALMAGITLLILRQLGCPLPVSIALTASIVATQPGLLAATGISGDALPVSLQLAAVGLVARSTEKKTLIIAATLCVVAVFVKLSAVWAPLAIGTWLVMKDRRKMIPFSVTFLSVFGGILALFLWVSRGRLWSNVFGLALSGVSGPASLLRPAALPGLFLERMNALSILIAFAVVGWLAAWLNRRLTIFDLSFAWAVAILLVVLTDVGADYNHLIDVVVLAAILAGQLWSTTAHAQARLIRASVPVVLGISLAVSFTATLASPTLDALASIRGRGQVHRFARNPLSSYLGRSEMILSEDPAIPVEMGLRPVVLDPFMLRTFDSSHPSWVADLVDRINRHEFDKVVLLKDLNLARDWYETWHFGPHIFQALKANYRLALHIHGYFLYVPRG